MRKFCIGDIHGSYKSLVQCLERSSFNKDIDLLITLGDIVDGWPDSYEVVEELLTIKNRIDIRGNHDQWFIDFMESGIWKIEWITQGGQSTLDSYKGKEVALHKKFFQGQFSHHRDEENRLFVHGGFDWKIPFSFNSPYDLMWNRHAFHTACQWEAFACSNPTEKNIYFKEFNEVYVGHTTTLNTTWRIPGSTIPLHVSNLWNMDTGGGYEGKLSIMDIDTKDYWQSDKVSTLYPFHKH